MQFAFFIESRVKPQGGILLKTAWILNTLFHYFQLYGYYIVFLGLLLENSAFIGLVWPGETVLLAASFFAARGDLNIILVIIYGIFGALIGNNIGYFLGLKGGRPFIVKFGHRFFISEAKIKAAEEYFNSHGGKTVFIGRFATGIRVFVSLLAGASRMNYGKFFIYTLLAVVIWTVGIGVAGYLFGQNWEQLLKVIERIGWGTLALIIIAIVGVYLYKKMRSKKRQL